MSSITTKITTAAGILQAVVALVTNSTKIISYLGTKFAALWALILEGVQETEDAADEQTTSSGKLFAVLAKVKEWWESQEDLANDLWDEIEDGVSALISGVVSILNAYGWDDLPLISSVIDWLVEQGVISSSDTTADDTTA